jgi:chromatin segregation and condensation protein Rec8/ScpA/Scc1 (kleisin family)
MFNLKLKTEFKPNKMIPSAQDPPLTDLTQEQIAHLDIRIAGKLIKDQALSLSHKTNNELMKPISQWLDDDKDWTKKFAVTEKNLPNWADYKRRQRDWTQQQRDILSQRMKLYHKDIARLRNLRTEVAKMLNSSSAKTKQDSQLSQDNNETPNSEITQKYNYLAPILTPYSPQAEHRRNTHQKFAQARQSSVSNLLPWRTILLSEIYESHSENLTLKSFKTYYSENSKKDLSSKLIHLLQLETEGTITLSQSDPFGRINVSTAKIESNINRNSKTEPFSTKPISTPEGSDIQIKDLQGNTFPVDWQQLSSDQRSKIVKDTISNKILCKQVINSEL